MRNGRRTFSSYFFYSVVAIVAGLVATSVVIKTGSYFYESFNAQNNNLKTATSADMPTIQKITSVPKSDLPVTATSYIAVNLETGEVYAQNNPAFVFPIASITKLITAAVAIENIPQNTLVTISQAALNTEGSSGKLKLGEKIKAGDLLYPLLMVSSNDAGEALARAHGRSAFISLMNEQAKAWGAGQTAFADPSGLSFRNTSTIKDMAKILSAIYKDKPEILDITRLKTKSVRGHTWTNPTHFLNLSSYRGGKNGYTDQANKTAASVFMMSDATGKEHPVGIIILRSNDRDEDTLEILEYVEELYR